MFLRRNIYEALDCSCTFCFDRRGSGAFITVFKAKKKDPNHLHSAMSIGGIRIRGIYRSHTYFRLCGADTTARNLNKKDRKPIGNVI